MSEVTVTISFRRRHRKIQQIKEYFPTIHIEKHLMSALTGLIAYGIDPEEYEPKKIIDDYLDVILEKQFVASIFWDEEFGLNDSLYLYDEDTQWHLPPQVGGFAVMACKLLAEIVRGIASDIELLFFDPFAFKRITRLTIEGDGSWLEFSGILN